MNRDQLAFLVGGFAFGILFGFGLFHALETQPELAAGGAAGTAQLAGPRGPAAPTDMGQGAGGAAAPQGAGGGPMVARINQLKSQLQQNPQDVRAMVMLGDIFYEVSMWAEASGYYEQAVELVPDNPDLMTDLGVCYKNLGRPEEALAMFARAREMDPSHWQSAFNTVVVATFDLQRFDVALDALETIEAMEPAPEGLDRVRLGQLRQALERAQSDAQAAPDAGGDGTS